MISVERRNVLSVVAMIVVSLTAPSWFAHAGEPTPMTRYQVEMVKSKRHKELVQLRGDLLNVELHEIVANFTYPSGKKGRAKAIVLFEPQSGAYWWTLSQKERFLKEYRVFFVRSKIVGIHFIDSPPRIIIEEQQKHAPAFNDAVNAVASEIERMIPKSEGGHFGLGREVNLFQALGLEFFRTDPPSANFGSTQFLDAKWEGDRWLVHLKGPNENEATVTLSENYELKGSSKKVNTTPKK